MYPIVRFAKDSFRTARMPRIGLFETHVSRHLCWPWDIDPWMELNNGRTLTLYDLGRIPLAMRTGLIDTLRREGWGLTVAGSVVRYRRRIRTFDRFETRSRLIGWDNRFLYIEQSMWKTDGECASHALFRSAITDRNGIVAPERIAQAMGVDPVSKPLPDWVEAWIAAEDQRPWPPMQDDLPPVA
ncbi:acyl-CoA thioesterase [Thetidibacter halocola]|uniref:Acyl-CoA thioesterase n=1 Tax=Thetidibacter halocola TaxID=2827239 RepID=A0A8J8B6L2_9RHOB|nr:acyl-CoA thioesterase [Thetidibacter halocola]MBS0123437.1 acyl-CoA thioesterase [Thetidibacter halocola]